MFKYSNNKLSHDSSFIFDDKLLFQNKKTMVVDVVIVAWYGPKGWERGEGGKKVMGGQLLPGKGPEWMGIRHHEQDIGLPSKRGFLYFLQKGVRPK
jgi:hypothetical protein